ncbi:MAG: chorismate mutase [Anaerolineales bacterium]|nr:chorismate mutase [Anaerolineales bacterium]
MTICRGVRGAVPVRANTPDEILRAADRLLRLLIEKNGIHPDDVTSAIFTTTKDVNAEYPAIAARKLGWRNVAMLCSHEMEVPRGLQACLRILIHWNTDKSQQDIVHVYLEEARSLRPDMFDQEGGEA